MDSLDKISALIKSLILPELREDLDNIPIETEHFKSYHDCLEANLPLLYDFVQQENFLPTGETNDAAKQEIHASLIVLLCEISSPNTLFKLNRSDLIYNAERILQNYSNLAKEVEDLLFKYYENKLHRDKWKRQLGAVHGFVKYLMFRFDTDCNQDQRMVQKCLTFCLSVALNIRSCYKTNYKTLSTLIFNIMLRRGNRDDVVSMNIHAVIYDAVFKDVHILDSSCFLVEQWNCLIKCLDFYENFDSFSWNYLDDMMEVLLRNISLSPDNSTAICLLKFVNKLIIYFTIDHKEFEEFFATDLSLVENLSECRSLASTNTSYTCYRWAKSILQMFIVESYKLMQTTEIAKQLLQEIHKIYILAIMPIRLSIVETHLIIFWEKFIAVLMEAMKAHKYQEDIMKLITSLLETFYFHLQSSSRSADLNKFSQSIYTLLRSEVFEKYVTI